MRFSIRGSGTDSPPSKAQHPPAGADSALDDPERVAANTVAPSQAELELIPEGGEVVSTGSPWLLIGRTFAQNRLAIIGVGIVVLIVLFSYVGPLIYHTDQINGNIINAHLAPSSANPLGTDPNGYDVLGRLMEGGQSSIEVGLAVGFASTLLGLIYGAISGYLGGWLDGLLMRLVDVAYAIPIVFLFIFMAQVFTPNLLLLIALLVATTWLIPARLVRGEALTLRTREYVQAVKVMGGGSWRIILRHIIPNAIGVIMVTVTFQVANAILTLAVLQYLGFGLPPDVPTWGSMLTDGTEFLQDGYWWLIYPALFLIVITVVAFNFIGDALQDAFDVRLQER
jgi:peptide/nickel transport system permease protein